MSAKKCVDCGRLWHEPDTNMGHCQSCRPDLFVWDKSYGTRRVPEEKIPWLILKRETDKDPWTVHSHHLRGRWYRYETIDKAISSSSESRRKKKLEIVVRSDRIHKHGILQCPHPGDVRQHS